MHVLILTVGTRGDVQPYVALAQGLIAAGHRVTICACQRFQGFIEQHGAEYAFMNNDMLEFMETDDGRIAMENTGNLFEFVRTAIRLMPKMGEMMRRQVVDLWNAVQTSKPDLILFHPKAIGAKSYAMKLQVPCVLAFYLPMYVSTGDMPAMGFPNLPLGRWYNRWTYRVIGAATNKATRHYAGKWMSENDLPPCRGPFMSQADGTPIPAIHAFSPAVVGSPHDWPSNATATGFWFLRDKTTWNPPDDLQHFLESGDSPVYVGFGSIFGRDPARTTRMVIEALRQTKTRAIIATGWGGLDAKELPTNNSIHVLTEAPHQHLFPRCSAIVHHGGCGTTAAALRAGKPSVILPFFGDQPFWGAQVHRLGAGPRPIRQKRLTTKKLADAIRIATKDEPMRVAAARIGAAIRGEAGVDRAVVFLERLFVQTQEGTSGGAR